MANITGDYDVGLELGLGLVNSVVAAIHENEDVAYPRLPHSVAMYVDDTYRGPSDPVSAAQRTGIQTRTEAQVSTPTISLPVEGLAEPIWSRARAAVRAMAGTAATGNQPVSVLPPGTRPTCWPKITAELDLRAWLRDTPDELPEFLHGDLYITAGLVRTDLGSTVVLGLDHSYGPQIGFEPAAGTVLTDEQRALVEQVLSNYIRGDAEPATFKLDLPDNVKRFDYKLEPAGPRQSAMLMLKLTDSAVPPRTSSFTARFLPSAADFAVAIGRDYLLQAVRGELLDGLPDVFSASGTGYSARIEPDWAGSSFDLQPGQIVFSVSGSGSVTYGWGWFSATDGFSFTITVRVALQVVAGSLRPVLAGDPEVDLFDVAVFEGTIHDHARDAIKSEFQARLDPLPPDLAKTLDVGKPLRDMIVALHPSPDPGVALTSVEIRTDGVVVGGTVALAPTRPVEVKRSVVGGLSDALNSWIPGGTIERFVWGSHVEEHRFVTDNPIVVVAPIGCLTVQGTRVTRGGGVVAVSAEDCPVLTAVLPVLGGLPVPPTPCRRPLLPLLSDAVAGGVKVVGHYDPWAAGLAPTAGPTNLLVHFAGEGWPEAAKALETALAANRKREAAVIVVGVVAADSLTEAAGAGLEADASLLVTDDPSGGWAAAFGDPKAPATVLVGSAGQIRWKGEGPLDPAKLGKVLDKELEPGGSVAWRPLGSTAAPGAAAPDAPVRIAEGSEVPLRRLRGGSVVLCFWSSCSEPSIKQLRELREAISSAGEPLPTVLGIGDGEGASQVAEVAKRERLPFALIPDPERSIANRYGISSWPATVQVNPQGMIVATDLGLVPGISPCVQISRPVEKA